MKNFKQVIMVGNKRLEVQFNYIHKADGSKYFITIPQEVGKIISFYMEQEATGNWKLADKYNMVPSWAHSLAPLLSDLILKQNRS